jgi:hypothetical protein
VTFTEFCRALTVERFAVPVPEWRPSLDHRIAGWERVRLIDQQEEEDAA